MTAKLDPELCRRLADETVGGDLYSWHAEIAEQLTAAAEMAEQYAGMRVERDADRAETDQLRARVAELESQELTEDAGTGAKTMGKPRYMLIRLTRAQAEAASNACDLIRDQLEADGRKREAALYERASIALDPVQRLSHEAEP